MFDSPEELLRKIRLGESSSLEFKRVVFRGKRMDEPHRDDLADEIAAMANTADCALILGVDDRTRQIEGIPLDKLEAAEQYRMIDESEVMLTIWGPDYSEAARSADEPLQAG